MLGLVDTDQGSQCVRQPDLGRQRPISAIRQHRSSGQRHCGMSPQLQQVGHITRHAPRVAASARGEIRTSD